MPPKAVQLSPRSEGPRSATSGSQTTPHLRAAALHVSKGVQNLLNAVGVSRTTSTPLRGPSAAANRPASADELLVGRPRDDRRRSRRGDLFPASHLVTSVPRARISRSYARRSVQYDATVQSYSPHISYCFLISKCKCAVVAAASVVSQLPTSPTLAPRATATGTPYSIPVRRKASG